MKRRVWTGVAVMIAVQMGFGAASNAVESRAVVLAIPVIGFFCAAACGAVTAQRPFVLPALLVAFAAQLLAGFALWTSGQLERMAANPGSLALLVAAGAVVFGAAAAGAIVGQRVAARRAARAAT